MALQPAVQVNRQQWDEALTKLLDLSTSTIGRNAELENRVAELELELTVWKKAHTTIREASELDKQAHKAQLAALSRQISSLEVNKQAHNPLIICAIDGEANIFNPSLLSRGQLGGRQAAEDLTKAIAEFLSQEGAHVVGRLSFWIMLYFNRKTLLSMLSAHVMCSSEQFDAFLSGFSQASPRFLAVEVGVGRELIKAKIKELIHTYARFPSTLRLFLGGSDDYYTPILTTLLQEELLDKLVLIQGKNELSVDTRQLNIPTVKVGDLLMSERLAFLPNTVGPIAGPVPISANLATLATTLIGGLPASPKSESPTVANMSPMPRTGTGGKSIDPTKPLHKQIPPPCNEFYLMSCSKGFTCKFSHEWALTPEHLDTLARSAKKAPCNYVKNGLECPYGDTCCWGHICPAGARCFHQSKGKCWFKGDEMHPPISP